LIASAVILMILNLLKVHQLLKWVPNLVIAGFLNGIAVLIIISQMNSLELWQDTLLMSLTFILSMGFSSVRTKLAHPITQLLLSSFFVIVLMTMVAHMIGLELTYLDLAGGSLFDSVELNFPPFEWPLLWVVLPLAFELALVALLDTLLTGVIMEKKTKIPTKHMQELSGQSIGLFVTGLIAGLPGAQSTVPSMMLYKEGGHHPWSKFFVAIFAALITLAFVPLIQYVPVAVFAGLIFKIAYDVADFTAIRSVFTHKEWISPVILIGTLLSTVLLSVNLAVIGFTMVFVLWNYIMPKKYRITDLEAEIEAEGMIDEL
jgi:SulP family sulfate permease